MTETGEGKSIYLPQMERLFALAIYILSLIVISKVVTGEWFPAESGKGINWGQALTEDNLPYR